MGMKRRPGVFTSTMRARVCTDAAERAEIEDRLHKRAALMVANVNGVKKLSGNGNGLKRAAEDMRDRVVPAVKRVQLSPPGPQDGMRAEVPSPRETGGMPLNALRSDIPSPRGTSGMSLTGGLSAPRIGSSCTGFLSPSLPSPSQHFSSTMPPRPLIPPMPPTPPTSMPATGSRYAGIDQRYTSELPPVHHHSSPMRRAPSTLLGPTTGSRYAGGDKEWNQERRQPPPMPSTSSRPVVGSRPASDAQKHARELSSQKAPPPPSTPSGPATGPLHAGADQAEAREYGSRKPSPKPSTSSKSVTGSQQTNNNKEHAWKPDPRKLPVPRHLFSATPSASSSRHANGDPEDTQALNPQKLLPDNEGGEIKPLERCGDRLYSEWVGDWGEFISELSETES